MPLLFVFETAKLRLSFEKRKSFKISGGNFFGDLSEMLYLCDKFLKQKARWHAI
jgi:hypothetical protein